MTLRSAALDDVLHGSANFAPWVIVQANLHDVVQRAGLQAVSGEDGLDGFVAAPFTIRTLVGEEVKAALWRHDGNPPDTLAIHLPLGMQDGPEVVAEIMREFGLPGNAVIW